MHNINYILATDLNWALGNKNDLIYFFKRDLQRFKEITNGKKVVMGSKTWDSLPFKLPNRTNIVLTNKREFIGEKQPDVIIHDIENILELSLIDEIWVIGGATLYNLLKNNVKKIELTLIHNNTADYDIDVKFLENTLNDFILIKNEEFIEIEKNSNNEIKIEFKTYVRKV